MSSSKEEDSKGSGSGVSVVGLATINSGVPHITQCADGTYCENNSPCIAHPIKEDKYMCDCSLAHLNPSGIAQTADLKVSFGGVYCEHVATSYCQQGKQFSDTAFCTNGGECRLLVGKNEEHAGCKCPPNYEGHYCQFVRGAKPSDWEMSDFMHPNILSSVRGVEKVGGAGGVVGLFILGILLIGAMVAFFIPTVNEKVRKTIGLSQKEGDTSDGDSVRSSSSYNNNSSYDSRSNVLPGRSRSSGISDILGSVASATSPTNNAEFMGGKSVYKKRASASNKPFVATAEALDANGAVLTNAIHGHPGGGDISPMEDVDLDDEFVARLGGDIPNTGRFV